MTGKSNFHIEIDEVYNQRADTGVAYTIGTLMSSLSQYECMKETFISKGFSSRDCEFIFIDNTKENKLCAFKGLNKIINVALGKYIILCHQDVRLEFDGREELDQRLAELENFDAAWAIAGNAGISPIDNFFVQRITDPYGYNRKIGSFPSMVTSIDENFIIVKRDSRISFSNDLSGFHFYGADICLNADIKGFSAYVIDFHLHHLSAGNRDAHFFDSMEKFQKKWSRALRSRKLSTTSAAVVIP